jgi:hypothetical protein
MSDGTVIPHEHLGAWTMCRHQVTQDELHYDVLALAQTFGFHLPTDALGRQEDYRTELGSFPVLGTGRIGDPAHAGDLAYMARRALDWLNDHAPDGRYFVLTDSLYCVGSPTERPSCMRVHPRWGA